MKRIIAKSVFVAALILAGVSSAEAQRAQTRKGFWFNGSLGWGSLGCDGCGDRTGGGSGGLSLGGTLNSRILLGVGTSGWYRSEGGTSLSSATVDARVRFYPAPAAGFFLTGGLGLGSVEVSVGGFGSGSDTGLGILAGLGYDARLGRNLSITPFANLVNVSISGGSVNVFQTGVGITLH